MPPHDPNSPLAEIFAKLTQVRDLLCPGGVTHTVDPPYTSWDIPPGGTTMLAPRGYAAEDDTPDESSHDTEPAPRSSTMPSIHDETERDNTEQYPPSGGYGPTESVFVGPMENDFVGPEPDSLWGHPAEASTERGYPSDMTRDQAALWKAIQQNPDSSEPRFQMADLLAERGGEANTAQAALIVASEEAKAAADQSVTNPPDQVAFDALLHGPVRKSSDWARKSFLVSAARKTLDMLYPGAALPTAARTALAVASRDAVGLTTPMEVIEAVDMANAALAMELHRRVTPGSHFHRVEPWKVIELARDVLLPMPSGPVGDQTYDKTVNNLKAFALDGFSDEDVDSFPGADAPFTSIVGHVWKQWRNPPQKQKEEQWRGMVANLGHAFASASAQLGSWVTLWGIGAIRHRQAQTAATDTGDYSDTYIPSFYDDGDEEPADDAPAGGSVGGSTPHSPHAPRSSSMPDTHPKPDFVPHPTDQFPQNDGLPVVGVEGQEPGGMMGGDIVEGGWGEPATEGGYGEHQDTGAQLTAAAVTNPNEDTPRLILADYYAENGRPDIATRHRVTAEAQATARVVAPELWGHVAGDDVRRLVYSLGGAAATAAHKNPTGDAAQIPALFASASINQTWGEVAPVIMSAAPEVAAVVAQAISALDASSHTGTPLPSSENVAITTAMATARAAAGYGIPYPTPAQLANRAAFNLLDAVRVAGLGHHHAAAYTTPDIVMLSSRAVNGDGSPLTEAAYNRVNARNAALAQAFTELIRNPKQYARSTLSTHYAGFNLVPTLSIEGDDKKNGKTVYDDLLRKCEDMSIKLRNVAPHQPKGAKVRSTEYTEYDRGPVGNDPCQMGGAVPGWMLEQHAEIDYADPVPSNETFDLDDGGGDEALTNPHSEEQWETAPPGHVGTGGVPNPEQIPPQITVEQPATPTPDEPTHPNGEHPVPPEEEAFWRQVDENPSDGTSRLVFADWLDDQGRRTEAQAYRVEGNALTLAQRNMKGNYSREDEAAAVTAIRGTPPAVQQMFMANVLRVAVDDLELTRRLELPIVDGYDVDDLARRVLFDVDAAAHGYQDNAANFPALHAELTAMIDAVDEAEMTVNDAYDEDDNYDPTAVGILYGQINEVRSLLYSLNSAMAGNLDVFDLHIEDVVYGIPFYQGRRQFAQRDPLVTAMAMGFSQAASRMHEYAAGHTPTAYAPDDESPADSGDQETAPPRPERDDTPINPHPAEQWGTEPVGHVGTGGVPDDSEPSILPPDYQPVDEGETLRTGALAPDADDTARLVYADYLDEQGMREPAHRVRLTTDARALAREVGPVVWQPGVPTPQVTAIRGAMDKAPVWTRQLYGVDAFRTAIRQFGVDVPPVATRVVDLMERYALGIASPDAVTVAYVELEEARTQLWHTYEESGYADTFRHSALSAIDAARMIVAMGGFGVNQFDMEMNNLVGWGAHEQSGEAIGGPGAMQRITDAQWNFTTDVEMPLQAGYVQAMKQKERYATPHTPTEYTFFDGCSRMSDMLASCAPGTSYADDDEGIDDTEADTSDRDTGADLEGDSGTSAAPAEGRSPAPAPGSPPPLEPVIEVMGADDLPTATGMPPPLPTRGPAPARDIARESKDSRQRIQNANAFARRPGVGSPEIAWTRTLSREQYADVMNAAKRVAETSEDPSAFRPQWASSEPEIRMFMKVAQDIAANFYTGVQPLVGTPGGIAPTPKIAPLSVKLKSPELKGWVRGLDNEKRHILGVIAHQAIADGINWSSGLGRDALSGLDWNSEDKRKAFSVISEAVRQASAKKPYSAYAFDDGYGASFDLDTPWRDTTSPLWHLGPQPHHYAEGDEFDLPGADESDDDLTNPHDEEQWATEPVGHTGTGGEPFVESEPMPVQSTEKHGPPSPNAEQREEPLFLAQLGSSDGTTRLAYADWLEENGHEHTADRMRYGVHLDRQAAAYDETMPDTPIAPGAIAEMTRAVRDYPVWAQSQVATGILTALPFDVMPPQHAARLKGMIGMLHAANTGTVNSVQASMQVERQAQQFIHEIRTSPTPRGLRGMLMSAGDAIAHVAGGHRYRIPGPDMYDVRSSVWYALSEAATMDSPYEPTTGQSIAYEQAARAEVDRIFMSYAWALTVIPPPQEGQERRQFRFAWEDYADSVPPEETFKLDDGGDDDLTNPHDEKQWETEPAGHVGTGGVSNPEQLPAQGVEPSAVPVAQGSEATTFQAAVANSPGDDTTRMVYADYLDETGDPKRAADIRLGVEMSNTARESADWSGILPSRVAQSYALGYINQVSEWAAQPLEIGIPDRVRRQCAADIARASVSMMGEHAPAVPQEIMGAFDAAVAFSQGAMSAEALARHNEIAARAYHRVRTFQPGNMPLQTLARSAIAVTAPEAVPGEWRVTNFTNPYIGVIDAVTSFVAGNLGERADLRVASAANSMGRVYQRMYDARPTGHARSEYAIVPTHTWDTRNADVAPGMPLPSPRWVWGVQPPTSPPKCFAPYDCSEMTRNLAACRLSSRNHGAYSLMGYADDSDVGSQTGDTFDLPGHDESDDVDDTEPANRIGTGGMPHDEPEAPPAQVHVDTDLGDETAARGFVSAVEASPEEMTHRVVFADWIEENAPRAATPDELDMLRTFPGRLWVDWIPGVGVVMQDPAEYENVLRGFGPWGDGGSDASRAQIAREWWDAGIDSDDMDTWLRNGVWSPDVAEGLAALKVRPERDLWRLSRMFGFEGDPRDFGEAIANGNITMSEIEEML